MKLLPISRSLLVIPICLSLASCGTKEPYISPLSKVHSVSIKSTNKPVKSTIYGDATTNTLAITGAAVFGLAGALVFGGAAAINNNRGVKRWSDVTKPQELMIKGIITESIQKEMKRLRGWSAPGKGPADANFTVDKIAFGVEHAGKQRFTVLVQFGGMLFLNIDQEEWWDDHRIGRSLTSWTLAEYKANPDLFIQGAKEAADALAAEIIQEFEN